MPKCKLCGHKPLILYGKVFGFVDTARDNPFLFHDEYYACPNCKAKFKKELNLVSLIHKGILRNRWKKIPDALFKYAMENMKKWNKEVLEDYRFKKENRLPYV